MIIFLFNCLFFGCVNMVRIVSFAFYHSIATCFYSHKVVVLVERDLLCWGWSSFVLAVGGLAFGGAGMGMLGRW